MLNSSEQINKLWFTQKYNYFLNLNCTSDRYLTQKISMSQQEKKKKLLLKSMQNYEWAMYKKREDRVVQKGKFFICYSKSTDLQL